MKGKDVYEAYMLDSKFQYKKRPFDRQQEKKYVEERLRTGQAREAVRAMLDAAAELFKEHCVPITPRGSRPAAVSSR